MESILGQYKISKIQKDRLVLGSEEIFSQIKEFNKIHTLTDEQIAVFTGEPDLKKIISLLALLEQGHNFCWVNINDSKESVKSRLQQLGKEIPKSIPGISKIILSPLAAALNPGSIIVFTSGSSSQAKGVVLSPDNFINSARSLLAEVDLNENDCWMLSAPCYHVSGLSIIFRALLSGCQLFIPEKISSAAIAKALLENEITHISLVPAVLYELIKNPALVRRLQELKIIMLGGSAVSTTLLKRAKEFELPVICSYGLSESAAAIAISENYYETELKLLPGVSIKISEQQEIIINTPALAEKYLNGEKISPDFKTRDCGRFINNKLLISGRLDRMIISGGEKIIPEEIENLCADFDEIKAAVVLAVKNSKWGERPVLIIETEKELNSNILIEFLRKNLAAYKVPDRVLNLQIPRLANGKIDFPNLEKKCADLLDPAE